MDKIVRMLGQFLGIVLFVALIGYVVISNLSPFGVTREYSLTGNKNTSFSLVPKNRFTMDKQNGQPVFLQTHDFIYFSTPMPFQFDSATVRMTFQNPDPDQTIALGFQNGNGWNYATKFFDVPFLNDLSWKRIGTSPTLYQRVPHFTSVSDFLRRPPQNALIGSYAYDTDLGISTQDTKLADYISTTSGTVIDTPLRGKHILYAYLENEPFVMTIKKQDLNWYEDPDPLNISVYKDNVLVFRAQIDDDGITDNSRKVMSPQEITIKNPGPGLPENGVYKIVLDANSDTVITQIKTNLHKIVFQGYLFPVANVDVYPSIVSSTSATTVYTNALTLSATILHSSALQDVQVGDSVLHVASTSGEATIIPKDTLSKVIIPQNDIILKGFQGFFAFSQDQFFVPVPYHIVPILQGEDAQIVDYILTDYVPPRTIGDWQIAERTFNLSSSFIKNNMLSWIIKSPGLQDNNRQVVIKDITIVFRKKAWF